MNNSITPITLPFGIRTLRKLPIPRKLGILERLYGKILAKHGVCWVNTSNDILWRLDLRDSSERWIVYGDYEGAHQMDWIRQWLSHGGTVVDSGANIGQMCLYLAPMLDVHVIAFEPLPEAANWIEECLDNYPDWRVSVHRSGLSDTNATVTLQIDGARSTAQMDWYEAKHLPTLDVNVTTLDDFFKTQNIPKIRLWKLDVEGHEPAALRGARGLLEQKKVEAILIEVSLAETIHSLTSMGYSLNRINKNGRLSLISDDSYRGNGIALPVTT